MPLLEQAAGGPVEGMVGVPEPLAAIQDAINIHGFDELIISTLPQRVSQVAEARSAVQGRGPRPAGHDRDRVRRAGAARRASLRALTRFWIWMQVIIVVLRDRGADHRADQALNRRPRRRRRRRGRWRRMRAAMIARMFRSIVVGTDGSETAGKAVARRSSSPSCAARRSASSRPTSRCRRRACARRPRQAPEDMQWMVNPREDVDATLQRGRREGRASAGVKVETFAREGDPADAILDVAEERDADLIVVGNKGMTGRQALPARLGAEQGLAPRALLGADHPDDLSADGTAGSRWPARRVDQARAVARVEPGRAEVARGGLQPGLDAAGRRVGPSTPEAMTSAAVAETCGAAIEVPDRSRPAARSGARDARRRSSGRCRGPAAGAGRQFGSPGRSASAPPPGATMSRLAARVGVVGLAAVLGGRADRHHVASRAPGRRPRCRRRCRRRRRRATPLRRA